MSLSKSPEKITNKEIIDQVSKVMLGYRGAARYNFYPWPCKILVVSSPDGKRQAYKADELQVLTPISIEGIAAEILAYISSHDRPPFSVDFKLAKDIALTYVFSAIPIADPPLIRGPKEPGYCFHRRPYDLDIDVRRKEMEDKCPYFADWISRIKFNREAVVRFIGSLFVDTSYNQQYLLLKGHGGDGKGAFLNCLHRYFGPTYAPSYSDSVKQGSRWTATTLNKRVVAFGDAQNLNFLNLEVFKDITGGTPVPYRFLYGEEFSAVSKAKFIVCTNEDAVVTGMGSDRRRRIYAEMEPPKQWLYGYQDLLHEEARIFFSWCKYEYLANCHDDQPIEIDKGVEDRMEEDAEEEFEAFIEDFCVMNGHVRQCDLYAIFRQRHNRSRRTWVRFKQFLTDKKGVACQRLDNQRWFVGISMKGFVAIPKERADLWHDN